MVDFHHDKDVPMHQRDEVTEQIIGAAIEVHRILGPGLLESIYEEALVVELGLRGMACQRQVPIDVYYKGTAIKGNASTFWLPEKSSSRSSRATVPDVAMAQVLSYLKATHLKRALLLNFGCTKMVDGIKRISL